MILMLHPAASLLQWMEEVAIIDDNADAENKRQRSRRRCRRTPQNSSTYKTHYPLITSAFCTIILVAHLSKSATCFLWQKPPLVRHHYVQLQRTDRSDKTTFHSQRDSSAGLEERRRRTDQNEDAPSPNFINLVNVS